MTSMVLSLATRNAISRRMKCVLALALLLGSSHFHAVAQDPVVKQGAQGQSAPIPDQYRQIWEQSQALRPRPSTDTTPVRVHVGSVDYQIPRNYLISFGSPEELQVTYPGFKPLTEETGKCFTPNPHPEEAECSTVKFLLHTSRGLTRKEQFENARKLFRNQNPQVGPYGFDMYEIGPEEAHIEAYRKDLPDHIVFVECMISYPVFVECMISYPRGKRDGFCDDWFQLDDKNTIHFFSPLRQLGNIEEIEDGIRRLMASFKSMESSK